MFMISWMQKQGGYTSNGKINFLFHLGLTIDEKTELERLRIEIKYYRDMDVANHHEETRSVDSVKNL